MSVGQILTVGEPSLSWVMTPKERALSIACAQAFWSGGVVAKPGLFGRLVFFVKRRRYLALLSRGQEMLDDAKARMGIAPEMNVDADVVHNLWVLRKEEPK